MKYILILAGGLLAPVALHAQTTPPAATPATPAPAASAAPVAGAAPAPIPLAPVTPPADPNALKIKAEYNPIGHSLAVKCDAPGPTRIEINDQEGRPVLTKNVIAGTTPVSFNVRALAPGPYVVRCTAGEKKGTRLVQLGQ
ncbi:hypothetical protein GO988_09155 [Hymenobacter sp. HMF4947]|uniref:T9SS type A sorting domain-containing protein n=1 Tax=Hymenobacter ginkgonis TaxID=2682976 RepID=A0A7K1TDL7_9BACT|nr:hypothetical protein [Hymenobacter ginkgonis]MVN76490.1 hypothetical protein [Hymenobacter ginkgonis]